MFQFPSDVLLRINEILQHTPLWFPKGHFFCSGFVLNGMWRIDSSPSTLLFSSRHQNWFTSSDRLFSRISNIHFIFWPPIPIRSRSPIQNALSIHHGHCFSYTYLAERSLKRMLNEAAIIRTCLLFLALVSQKVFRPLVVLYVCKKIQNYSVFVQLVQDNSCGFVINPRTNISGITVELIH